MNQIPYTKEQLFRANARLMEKNKRYRERIEYMLEEAKDHKRKGLRIQHWALIKDLEETLEKSK